MKNQNHTLISAEANFNSVTGSRNRVRIPVLGAKLAGFKPGDRVGVNTPSGTDGLVIVFKAPKYPNHVRTYKVEKDGAVRFPAGLFGLNSTVNLISDGDVKFVVLH